jgi:hypothetical protein
LKTESLSLHEARARALAAQGFDRERGKVDAKALERVVAATQLFQIDSVSVVVRRTICRCSRGSVSTIAAARSSGVGLEAIALRVLGA